MAKRMFSLDKCREGGLRRSERERQEGTDFAGRRAANGVQLALVRSILASPHYAAAAENDYFKFTLVWLEGSSLRKLSRRAEDLTHLADSTLRNGIRYVGKSVDTREHPELYPDWMNDTSLLPKRPPGRK